MKRATAVFAALLLAASCTGCGSGSDTQNSSQTAASSAAADSAAPANADSTANTAGVITNGSKCGVLQKCAEQNALTIRGLLLTTGSGHHSYPAIADLIKDGYKTENLYSTYLLNEWFEIYGDCNKSVNIYVVPNQADTDYAAMTEADLQKIDESAAFSNSVTDVSPDTENNGLLWSTYVNSEMGAGLYNVCFVSDGKLCYLVQLNLEPEKAE